MNILQCNFLRCNRCGKCLINDTIQMDKHGKVRFVKKHWDDVAWSLKAMAAASQCPIYAFDAVNVETGERTPCKP